MSGFTPALIKQINKTTGFIGEASTLGGARSRSLGFGIPNPSLEDSSVIQEPGSVLAMGKKRFMIKTGIFKVELLRLCGWIFLSSRLFQAKSNLGKKNWVEKWE